MVAAIFIARTTKGGARMEWLLDLPEPEFWQWLEAAEEVERRIADAMKP